MVAAINITFNVIWLDTASHIVKLIFGLLIEGITNGNIALPAVIITPISIVLVVTNANAGLFSLDSIMAKIADTKASTGNTMVSGILL